MPDAPALVAVAPPVRRDAMVLTWVAASAFSWLGTSAWVVALAWVAVREFSAAQAGVVVAVATLPQALLTVVGGVVADRADTRRVMIAGQAASAAVLLLGAALWTRVTHLPLLLGIGIAFGVVAGLTQPASATLVRQLVETRDLPTVGGWNQIAVRLARLGGAPLGAGLVTWLGLPAVMLFDAATFLIAGAALGLVVRPRFRLPRDTAASWWRGLGGGVTYLRRDRTALVLVVGLAGLNVFCSPLISLGVPLRITGAGWPAATLGATEAWFSGAAIVGSLAAIRLRPARPAWTAFVMLAGQGASYGLVAVPDRVALTAAMVIIGFTAGCCSVWLSAEFVRIVEPTHLGRTASLSTLGDLLLIPLVTPAFGALTARVGIGVSPFVLAAGMIVLCAAIAAQPRIRALRRPEGAGDVG